MTNFTGSLTLSGTTVDSQGDHSKYSGTFGVSLTASFNGAGTGSATETVTGTMSYRYYYGAQGTGGGTTPFNFSTPTLAFQGGSFVVNFNIPLNVGGSEFGVAWTGTLGSSQASISESVTGTISGINDEGNHFTGTIVGTGTLQTTAPPPPTPPVISGTVAGQTTGDETAVAPFSKVTIADPNAGQTETVTVTESAPANGALSNLAGGAFNATIGVYTVSGSAAAVSTALDDLIFTPTPHQAAAGQTVTTGFAIAVTDTANASATDTTTTVVATETAPSPGLPAVNTAYQGILRVAAPTVYANQIASQIDSGMTTLTQFETGLIGLEQTLYTTAAALVTIDAFYNATPTGAGLTTVATATGGTGYYTAAELHNLGYSDTNVWTVLASGWGADPNSSFYQQYNADATGSTPGYTAFINAVYAQEFGTAPSTANLNNLLADLPGAQALLNGGGHTATPIQVMAGLYGYLLEVGQADDIGHYAAATKAFLLAAASGSTVIYGPELTAQFPSASPLAPGASRTADSGAGVIVPSPLIGASLGGPSIQFLTPITAAVLSSSGADQETPVTPVSGAADLAFPPDPVSLDLAGTILPTSFLTPAAVTARPAMAIVSADQSTMNLVPARNLVAVGGKVTGDGTLFTQAALKTS